MSPLWNKPCYVWLSPGAIRLFAQPAWSRAPKLLSEQTVTPGVDSALQLFTQLLEKQKLGSLHIVLSNQLVQYDVLQLEPQLTDYAAKVAFAKHQLQKCYGNVVAQWELRIHQQKHDSLICAVDSNLLEQLRQVAAQYKVKIRSITPSFAPVFNQYLKKINSPAWLVVHEPGYSLCVLLQHKHVQTINGHYHDAIGALPQILDRENITGAMNEACHHVYLYGSELAFNRGGYEWHVLPAEVYENPANGISFNYQRDPEKTRQLAGWLLLIVGSVLFADALISYQTLLGEKQALATQISNAKTRSTQVSKLASPQKNTDLDQWINMVSRLQMPWEQLFAALESIKQHQAAVLNFEANPKTKQIRMQGEAKDYAALLSLIAELNNTMPFKNVVLQQHEIKQNEPQQPVSFTLIARWEVVP